MSKKDALIRQCVEVHLLGEYGTVDVNMDSPNIKREVERLYSLFSNVYQTAYDTALNDNNMESK